MGAKPKNRHHGIRKPDFFGVLADGVADDFNNILTVIIGACSLLEMDTADNSERMQCVARIRNYAERAAQLTRSLQTYGGRHASCLDVEDLTVVIHEMFYLLSRIAGNDFIVTMDLPDQALPVMIDRGQIEQVVMRLTAYFREVVPPGGSLRIHLTRIEGESVGPHGFEAGGYALVTFYGSAGENSADAGKSVSIGKGFRGRRGLALSMIHGIMVRHGGSIQVRNDSDRGKTEVILSLPLCDQEERMDVKKEGSGAPGGTETILLLNTDPVLLSINTSLLEGAGYLVLSASDGMEALELFQRIRDGISLVILDTGPFRAGEEELYKQLKTCARDLEILVVVNPEDGVDTGRNQAVDGFARLTKPFDPLRLLKYIRQSLDNRLE